MNTIVEEIEAKQKPQTQPKIAAAGQEPTITDLSSSELTPLKKVSDAEEHQDGPNELSDQVQVAQRLFKKFNRRLDVFKSIKLEQEEVAKPSKNEKKAWK